MTRITLVTAEREARERDHGSAFLHRSVRPVVLVPGVVTLGRAGVPVLVAVVAWLRLVYHPVVLDARHLRVDGDARLARRCCRRWVVAAAGQAVIPVSPEVAFRHEAHLRRELVIEPDAALLGGQQAVFRNVELRIWGRPHARARVVVVILVHEEVQLVLDDGAAERAGNLLVCEGDDLSSEGILRIANVTVAEVAAERAGIAIGPGLGDDVHLYAKRASLRRVKTIRDELQ